MSNSFELVYKRYGEHSILIEWPSRIEEEILKDILEFKDVLLKEYGKTIRLKSAFNSILVTFIHDFNDKITTFQNLYHSKKTTQNTSRKLWHIPVCYDACYGLDLDVISAKNKISKEGIIQLHTAKTYTVYGIGFLPGFLYLGGLHPDLFISRRESPRLNIIKGAVGIGEQQTGIYPSNSPGGWQIIGNSPINFFDKSKSVPCFAKPGDNIRFFSINKEQHFSISELIKGGVYDIKNEPIND